MHVVFLPTFECLSGAYGSISFRAICLLLWTLFLPLQKRFIAATCLCNNGLRHASCYLRKVHLMRAVSCVERNMDPTDSAESFKEALTKHAA
jgi:hypothetical protein